MIEAISVSLFLVLFVSGLLVASYLLFARSWVDYQTEQALYCMAEGRPTCRASLEKKISQLLPWGRVEVRRLSHIHDRFFVEARWKLEPIDLLIRKNLKIKDIAKNRDLRL